MLAITELICKLPATSFCRMARLPPWKLLPGINRPPVMMLFTAPAVGACKMPPPRMTTSPTSVVTVGVAT